RKQVGDAPLNFTAEFDSWKDVDGIKLPAKSTFTASTGYRSTEVLEGARFNVALSETFFARPADTAPRPEFATGHESLNIPIVEENGQVLVQGKINTAGPVWIALDTGASSAVVDEARGPALRVQATARIPATGAGGSHSAGSATGITFELPGVILKRQ